ncbi:ADP-ribosylation factor-like protein 15 [Mactra antiquata]
MCENIQLMFAVLRISIYSLFRRLCCKGPPPVRPNFTVLCLGIGKSGKSTLLAKVSGESTDEIEPTVGFSIKALMFDECFVDVKELGGGDNVRPYWDRYYTGAQGIIYVIDCSSDEETMEKSKKEFDKAMGNHQLDGLPLLVLANYQDVPGARNESQIKQIFELETLDRFWVVQPCTASDKSSIEKGFNKFNSLLLSPARGKGEFDQI